MNAVCAEPEHMLVSEAAKNVKCMDVRHAQQNAVAGQEPQREEKEECLKITKKRARQCKQAALIRKAEKVMQLLRWCKNDFELSTKLASNIC